MSFAIVGRTQPSFSFFNKDNSPQNVKELTESLIANKDNDSLKIVEIYKWITENVSYDHAVFMSGEPIRFQSPELVFQRKKTTCTGYSNLMVAMLEYAGINAYPIEGFTQDYVLGLEFSKLSSDHAWVAFKLNGNWHLADPTWDAGEIGILKNIQKEKVKKTFWQRLRSLKFKHLFNKKERTKNKITSRDKVSYKIGFNRKPSMQYIFSDPNVFVKTHLPNVAHIQMKSAPINVAQFCDSLHALGNKHYSQTGSYNYNAFNDTYYQLSLPERMLWLSDSSLNYHYLNHGDKALNAHNYLAYFYGEKTSSKNFIENYIAIADTVILHSNLAIKINKQEFKKKKMLFTEAFLIEKKQDFSQKSQVNFIQKHLLSNTDVYKRGRDRITQKEIGAITKYKSRIVDKFGFPKEGFTPIGWENDPQIIQLLEDIQSMKDSILYYQKIEKDQGPNYIDKLNQSFHSARSSMYHDAQLMYKGKFLNEKKFLKKDKEVIDSLTLLNSFIRDSINTYLGNRTSYGLLLKMDQQLKTMDSKWESIQKVDSLFPSKEFQAFGYYILFDLLTREKELIDQRLKNAQLIENTIKNHFVKEAKNLGLDMKDLSYIKSMRQAYLTKMMNNKYNRSIKVYSIILSNATKWKAQYQTKLKRLEE